MGTEDQLGVEVSRLCKEFVNGGTCPRGQTCKYVYESSAATAASFFKKNDLYFLAVLKGLSQTFLGAPTGTTPFLATNTPSLPHLTV